jgi:hypothetical protein
LVSGNTTTAGGAANTISGGRAIPTLTFTAASVVIGKTLINTKSIVPKNNFFILSSPLSNFDATQVKN